MENFCFEILEVCDKANLNDKEIFWVKKFSANNPKFGYNLTKGGNFSHSLVLNETLVCEIQDKLKNTNLTQQQIADEFNVSQRTISYINDGTLWYNEKNIYPLRHKTQITHLCSICKKPIYRQSKLCPSCQHLSCRKTERPNRDLLKHEIRNFCFSDLATKYNVSPTTIRRWCNYYNLPSLKKEISSFSENEWDKV